MDNRAYGKMVQRIGELWVIWNFIRWDLRDELRHFATAGKVIIIIILNGVLNIMPWETFLPILVVVVMYAKYCENKDRGAQFRIQQPQVPPEQVNPNGIWLPFPH
jgi:hypothetical protein